MAIVERIGRSIRLRRHAAAALNRHSIAGGLTGNCKATNFVRFLAGLLPFFIGRAPHREARRLDLRSPAQDRDPIRRIIDA